MKEFVVLMAFLMALVALSIDTVLPALGLITSDLGIRRANDVQFVVTVLFLGMALSTIIYGPLSDTFGRKPVLLAGLVLFICGSTIAYMADNLAIMLCGRFIQGFGAGAPRILTSAIVRDRYHGRDMAAVMSLIMGIFILVPALAPALGQAILYLYDWHGIFILYIAAGIIALLWQHFRLPETLRIEKRSTLDFKHLVNSIKEAATTRATLGYAVCSGLIFGCLVTYISTSQQIFHDIFKTGDMFAFYFGLLAIAIGAAFFANAKLVKKYGMRKITLVALIGVTVGASVLFMHTMLAKPSLPAFMLCAIPIFFGLGLTFGNLNAMAMEPMGHIAGLAAAFIGSFSTTISLSLGITLGQLYNGTLLPLVSGFLVSGLGALIIMIWTEKGMPHANPENATETK